MDRNRDARRSTFATSNGLSRRRHRASGLRDSPDDDGPVELPDTSRLRERTLKKDRDIRNRDRDIRDRDRDRGGVGGGGDRYRSSNRSKRQRSGDNKYNMHGSHRDDGGDDTSEDSINYEDDDGPVRFNLPSNNHHYHHQTTPSTTISSSSAVSSLTHRKSYPPPSKVYRVSPTWKPADDMIGVSVPRKARSASTKRLHDWSSAAAAVVGENLHRQASLSPVRLPGTVAASPSLLVPVSPCSSNISTKKKIKLNGSKQQRPPKSSLKSSPSVQDDIEIEVAEVLYGLMRQSQAPLKPEVVSDDSAKLDSRHRSVNDSKSRVSSPITNPPSVQPQPSSAHLQNWTSSSHTLSIVAPKRKRPRAVSYPEDYLSVSDGQNRPTSALPKVESTQLSKSDIIPLPPNLEKSSGPPVGNGIISGDLMMNSQGNSASWDVRSESRQQEGSRILSDANPSLGESENRVVFSRKMEEDASVKEESSPHGLADSTSIKANSSIVENLAPRGEKIEIDLMAPPPHSRPLPERYAEMAEYGGAGGQKKSVVAFGKAEIKQKDGDAVKVDCELNASAPLGDEKKANANISEEGERQKLNLNNKERNIDLQLNLEKVEGTSNVDDNKLNQQFIQKQQPPKSPRNDPSGDKSAQTCSLPLSISIPAGWPPIGYMPPLQGVVSMDGSTMAATAVQPPQLTFNQPRSKRCATHCYIAKNIQSHQQFLKNCPFWPPAAAATAAPLFGAKSYNLNMMPSSDMPANAAGKNFNSVQEKGQALAFFPGHPASKDKALQQPNVVDGAQEKPFMMPQNLPPGAPSNILPAPAFVFPVGQQQTSTAASASPRPNLSKSAAAGSSSSTSPSTIVAANNSTTGAGAPSMSFNYTSMAANETKYLAILGNSPYPFPIPAHVGAAPPYHRGAQAMPFFNGSFYSSQMLHPSHMQQQQHTSQSMQTQQGPPNPSLSSSTSQKHLQNQQARVQGNGSNAGSPNPTLQSFPTPKNRGTQLQQHEVGGEDSPSTAKSRGSRPNMNVYGQTFTLPMHPPNFSLLTTPTSLGGGGGNVTGSDNNANHGEKKQQAQAQQQAMKAGVESLTPQAFAMSFGNINGATAPGFDISSIAQNHVIFQSLPEAARHGYQMMAAAAAAQAAHQKNYRGTEEGKPGAPDSSLDEEKKSMTSRASNGQSIAFSRPELVDTSISALSGSNVVDTSAQSLNLVPGPNSRSARTSGSNVISNVSASNAQQQKQQHRQQQQHQQQQQQQQQMLQFQKQQQFAAAAVAAARNKAPGTGNGNVYPEHLSVSSSMAAKFPTLSGFPPLVQGSGSPAHSSQWKNSARPTPSQVSSTAVTTQSSPAMKNLSQQQGRSHQGQTHLSFGANQKPSGQGPNNILGASSPMMAGSPSSSSVSKSAGGSPRTSASTSTGNKAAQNSVLASQGGKNSPSMPGQKSSSVGPSILGSPHVSTSSSTGSKGQPSHQSQQLLQQPQLSKSSIQQAQLYFSNAAFMQAPHSSNASIAAASTASGYYLQRHSNRPEQQQQGQKSQGTGGAAASSIGMLSLCPPANAGGTSDPSKAMAAAAAAAGNMKGGRILTAAQFAAAQTFGGTHQLVPSFPYVHAVPTVKPPEQKQPAGNDNLNACWQPEKK